TRFPVLSPVFLVFPVFPVGIARSIGPAQCALPALPTGTDFQKKILQRLDKRINRDYFIKCC
ncbi:MAG: hypothetical protein IJC34_06580, partial [Lentisphaeria bacterium]|nr:hypothetical protein [Lentisphaeria bacterium]